MNIVSNDTAANGTMGLAACANTNVTNPEFLTTPLDGIRLYYGKSFDGATREPSDSNLH